MMASTLRPLGEPTNVWSFIVAFLSCVARMGCSVAEAARTGRVAASSSSAAGRRGRPTKGFMVNEELPGRGAGHRRCEEIFAARSASFGHVKRLNGDDDPA